QVKAWFPALEPDARCLLPTTYSLRLTARSIDRGAFGDPVADELALFGGHLGDVAQRHDLAGDRLRLNARSLGLDLLRGVEHHAGRRGAEQWAGRLGRVAHGAAFLDDIVDLVEAVAA